MPGQVNHTQPAASQVQAVVVGVGIRNEVLHQGCHACILKLGTA
jgi:hypothetical protein